MRDAAAQDRTRDLRLDAYSALGAALVSYRHAQLARQTHKLRSQPFSAALAEEVRRARGDAWAAYFRVELLTRDEVVLSQAMQALSLIRALKSIDNLDQLDRDADAARQAINGLVREARKETLSGG